MERSVSRGAARRGGALGGGLILAAGLAMAGCGGGGGGGDGQQPPSGPLVREYVTSRLMFPFVPTAFAVDVDGDGQVDNAMAGLATAADQRAALQTSLNSDIEAGNGLLLLRLTSTTADADPAPSLQLNHAAPQPSPDFGGDGAFTVADGDVGAVFTGPLAGGAFLSDVPTPATPPLVVDLRLFSDAPPARLILHGARVGIAVSPTGAVTGQLDGVLDPNEATPGLSVILAKHFEASPSSMALGFFDKGCPATPEAQNLDGTAAADSDRKLAPCELLDQVRGMLTPDLRAFDDQGGWKPIPGAAPEQRNGFSIGIGFVAAPATF